MFKNFFVAKRGTRVKAIKGAVLLGIGIIVIDFIWALFEPDLSWLQLFQQVARKAPLIAAAICWGIAAGLKMTFVSEDAGPDR